ncbi:unnamed protein product [Moneuplotes crassus]|uniref:Uncharacterized protein n=1 Tax=Euplotes crassus TaxID=5936 RepID=A0AAD2D545_EUPCR|nr:unnamed protein product [Moneuplotes crassus]
MEQEIKDFKKKSISEAFKCSKTPFCKHESTCINAVIAAFGKGLCSGALLKGVIQLVISLVRTRSIGTAFKDAVSKDTLKFAAFIALLPTIYKIINCFLRRIRKTDDNLNPVISGIISSTAAIADPYDYRRKLIIYYVFARAFDTSVNCSEDHKSWKVPESWPIILNCIMVCLFLYLFYSDSGCLPEYMYNYISNKVLLSSNDSKFMEILRK